MKQTRFLLAALLLMVCGIMAHAQKVVVYKHDGTKVEYASSDVKDVKYEKGYKYGIILADAGLTGITVDSLNKVVLDKSELTSIKSCSSTNTKLYTWFIFPTEWGTPVVMLSGLEAGRTDFTNGTVRQQSVVQAFTDAGYTCWRYSFATGDTMTIKSWN